MRRSQQCSRVRGLFSAPPDGGRNMGKGEADEAKSLHLKHLKRSFADAPSAITQKFATVRRHLEEGDRVLCPSHWCARPCANGLHRGKDHA